LSLLNDINMLIIKYVLKPKHTASMSDSPNILKCHLSNHRWAAFMSQPNDNLSN